MAFALGAPIGALGGLVGLGGAEFRLPVLVRWLGFPLTRAIPLNLAISLVTLLVSLGVRSHTLSLRPVVPHGVALLGLLVGSLVGAFRGPQLARELSVKALTRTVFSLLVALGGLLVVEGLQPRELPPLLSRPSVWNFPVGVVLGLGIGIVSSLLGVAGGELLIPTLVLVFGADVKTAGTGSVFIGLATVALGVARWHQLGGYADRWAMRDTVLPMAGGSVLGAVVGGLLAPVAPSGTLKVFLGLVLIWSAVRTFASGRSGIH